MTKEDDLRRIDELERRLVEQISYHRQAFEKAVEPLYARLRDIQNLKPMPPLYLSASIIAEHLLSERTGDKT